jgi:hypothetical protein
MNNYIENKYIFCDRCTNFIYIYKDYENEQLCIKCLEETGKKEVKNIEYKFY